jgi:FAD/FMN-containing dehydrogenase
MRRLLKSIAGVSVRPAQPALAPNAHIHEDVLCLMSQTTAPPPPRSTPLDASALEASLRRHLRGEVRFDSGSRAVYATDGSNYRQVPIGVVIPRDKEDVLATVALCRDHRAPLLARGGGTSLAGQCCNAAVILDFSKYMAAILEIDPERRIARVEPGVVLDNLRAAAEKHHLTFAPDPATHDRCTLGGMIGNNSCGVHSIMAGKTDDNVEALEIPHLRRPAHARRRNQRRRL